MITSQAMVPAAQVPFGYFSFDVIEPGVAARFDVTNQTGLNSTVFPDTTWPVATPVQFSIGTLTVQFNDGSESVFGAGDFTPADGGSLFGTRLDIAPGNRQPTGAILTGSFGSAAVALNDGTQWDLIAASFRDETGMSDPAVFNSGRICSDGVGSGCLQDGDFVAIYASADPRPVPEPGTLFLTASAILGLLYCRRRITAGWLLLGKAAVAFSQQPPTIQNYAAQCFQEVGRWPDGKSPFPLSCTDAKEGQTVYELSAGGELDADGKCLAPSWASTHEKVPGKATPFQCFGNGFVLAFGYDNRDGKSVRGALLCKNEIPANNKAFVKARPMFDYVSMILYNTESGKSCWFTTPKDLQVGVKIGRDGELRDGKNVVDPEAAGAHNYWQAPQDTSNVHCWKCHDNGVWMNSPWLYVSNRVTAFKDRNRGYPYRFAATGANFGFEKWPSPIYASPNNDACTSCHLIGARQQITPRRGDQHVSNTFSQWLGWATGGGTSPVKNAGAADPPGSNADPAQADNASWQITHWMPPRAANRKSGENVGVDKYKTAYERDLVALQTCMEKVGKFADEMRPRGDVLAAIRQREEAASQNKKDDPFGIPGCHADESTWKGAAAQRLATAANPRLALTDVSDEVGESAVGLILTGEPVTSEGMRLPTIIPGSTGSSVPSGSTVTVSWQPGPHQGCSIVALFPPGVSVPNPQSSGVPKYASGGRTWASEQSPQTFGPLVEPGEYAFTYRCGFQSDAELVTQAKIRFHLTGTVPGGDDPPTLMRLFTSTDRRSAEAADWISYANPAESYTIPQVLPGRIPETDIPAGPSESVRLTWTADNVLPGSCSLQNLQPGPGDQPFVAGDVGDYATSLGLATDRVFQLSCKDVRGVVHRLRSRVHRPPAVQPNVTTSADTGTAGVTFLNVTASGFSTGTVTPSSVFIPLSRTCDGSPDAVTVASGVTQLIGTSKRVQFQLPQIDPGTYYVSVSDVSASDTNFVSSRCSKVTVRPAP